MAEASKKLASKEYTLDLRDKNRGKMKNFLKRLIFSYYVGKVTLMMIDQKVI